MKNFKWTPILMGILMAAQFSAASAYADSGDSCQEKIESLSKKIEELEKALAKIKAEPVSNGQPASGWKDPDGLIWGKALGRRMNHPDAEKACKELGLRLPTKEEFELLVSRFDRDKRGHLTNKGRADLYSVLPDMEDRWFWSGSVHPDSAGYGYAYDFNDYNGGNSGFVFRKYNYSSVLCVGR